MTAAALKEAAEKAIAAHPDRRILSFTYDGKTYFIKRKLSNGRNRFAKADSATAFWCEAYKIALVNQYIPLAPPIVCYAEDYFVMENAGVTLHKIGGDPSYRNDSTGMFRLAGKALSELHHAGLHHGRPALRDIACDIGKRKITFLDWENDQKFIDASRQDIDIFLFIQGYIRENWKRPFSS